MSEQAAAALIAAIPVGAGAAGAADANAPHVLVGNFMRDRGNVLQVDNIVGMLDPLTDEAVVLAVPDNKHVYKILVARVHCSPEQPDGN